MAALEFLYHPGLNSEPHLIMAQSTSPNMTTTAPPISPATPMSPSQARKSSQSTTAHTQPSDATVPLDSPLRTTSVHPSLPALKLPSNHPTSNVHPFTLQPFSESDLKTHGYEKLRAEYEDGSGGLKKSEIEKAREEAVGMLRERMAEREGKEREIEREVEEKEKIREVERKVYRKKMADKGKEGV